jgi:hypothetical protein
LIPVSNLHHLHSKSAESDEIASVRTSQRSITRNKPCPGEQKKLLKSNSRTGSKTIKPKEEDKPKTKGTQIKIVYRPLSARQNPVKPEQPHMKR